MDVGKLLCKLTLGGTHDTFPLGYDTIHKSGDIPRRLRRKMKGLRISQTLVVSVCALFLLLPMSSDAQRMGMGGMGMGGMGMGPYGMGGMGFGPGGMGGMEGPGALVTVKYGEKVYDAVFGDLVEARVLYVQVPADTIGVHYFDDGTHGDEIPYDGMPSNITINRDTYLGPFAIKYKNILEKAFKAAKDMGPIQFYNIGVATKDSYSKVTKLGDWERRMSEFFDDKIASRLEQFKGFDDETYVKAVDPSLFESLEGMGGMSGGGFGAGSMYPDLPPPPGLPNPMDLQSGTTGEGALTPPDGGAASPPPAQPFNPIQRARDAAGAANAGGGAAGLDPTGSLQATEAMNSLP